MASIWHEFDHDPRDPGHAPLRAADKDRDVVRRAIGEAYAEGRLDHDEMDARTDAVMATRTLGELPALIEDLVPAVDTTTSRSPEERHQHAVRAWRKDRKDAFWQFLSASVICWVIWVATSFGGGGFDPYFPWPAFVTLGTGINLGRIVFMREEMVEREVARLEKKERKALERKRVKRLEIDPPTED